LVVCQTWVFRELRHELPENTGEFAAMPAYERVAYCTSTKSPAALTAGVVEVPAKL